MKKMFNKTGPHTITGIVFLTIIMLIGLTSWIKAVPALKEIFNTREPSDMAIAKKAIKDTLNISVKGRKELARLNVNLNFFLTGQIMSVQVASGKNGWLFFKTISDGNALADYQGTDYFSEEKKKATLDKLQEINEYLKSDNIDLTLLVIPNKENIYYRYMPDDIERISDISRTDILIDYLKKNSKLNIVYPKNVMIAASNKIQIWHEFDSHWNQVGAFIAVQEMLKSWYGNRKKLEKKNIILSPSNGRGDLARLIGMSWYFIQTEEYRIKDIDEVLSKAFYDQQQHTYSTFQNPNAPRNESIFLIGDSFRDAMVALLSAEYKTIYIAHREHFNKEMITECNPNRLILQYVERHTEDITSIALP